LEKSADYELKDIYGIFKEYRVQFVGYVKDGHKIIHCNFFHNMSASNDFAYWKEREALVLDGGLYFWHCHFDLDEKRIFDLLMNGYAWRTILFFSFFQ
jgi:hypothetical protein